MIPFRTLPFQFDRMADGRYLASSMAGDPLILSRATIEDLIAGRVTQAHPEVDRLCAGLFLSGDRGLTEIDLLANRLRTKLFQRSDLAGLHIIVVTMRCPNSCRYCQVSHAGPGDCGNDMSLEDADYVVNLIMQSPSPALKIEFQGGEPLLNMPVVERILELCEKQQSEKDLSYVIATSLQGLQDQHLELFKKFRVAISTSLDGPKDLHDINRPTALGSSYEAALQGILRCREVLGADQVSALMTTTRATMNRIEEVVDEYVRLEFPSIFLRWLNPFGGAIRHQAELSIPAASWLETWKRGLARVLFHVRQGIEIREEFAAILLKRMLSPFPCGFVDLDNPTGSGLHGLVYHVDGFVYPSDEARMLAAMGDPTFRLGSIHDRFEFLMNQPAFRAVVSQTMLEASPRCASCACRPWCGADPVLNYATQGDLLGWKPWSEHCIRMEGAFHHLARLLEGPDRDVLMDWGLS